MKNPYNIYQKNKTTKNKAHQSATKEILSSMNVFLMDLKLSRILQNSLYNEHIS